MLNKPNQNQKKTVMFMVPVAESVSIYYLNAQLLQNQDNYNYSAGNKS